MDRTCWCRIIYGTFAAAVGGGADTVAAAAAVVAAVGGGGVLVSCAGILPTWLSQTTETRTHKHPDNNRRANKRTQKRTQSTMTKAGQFKIPYK